MKQKAKYTPPTIEVIPMETENVIAGSPGSGGTSDMPIVPLNSSHGTRSYSNAATANDLEDLINDLFTVEQ